jgi:hypothetical protein
MSRKWLCSAIAVGVLGSSATFAQFPSGAPDGRQSREGLTEPLYRISKARLEPKTPDKPADKVELRAAVQGEHPLDPAIVFAKDCLQRIHAGVHDYSCTIVKQERIDDELYPQEYMYAEIRNRKLEGTRVAKPFSVYLYFLKPEKIKGREVIYVEGQNDGKLMAHEANFLKVAGVFNFNPTDRIAMRGNRYPITDIGLENLVTKLIEKAERDRQHGECTVQFKPGVKINGRGCTMLEVVHPQPRPHFDFNIARVYIDDELSLPVRYEAYSWPTRPDGQPELIECYTYLNLKINVGLEDKSFVKERFKL